jgi:hypothetical protein
VSISEEAKNPAQGWRKTGAYLDLEEVLWWAIDLFEALLARVWHGLHGCGSLEARAYVLFAVDILVLGMKG